MSEPTVLQFVLAKCAEGFEAEPCYIEWPFRSRTPDGRPVVRENGRTNRVARVVLAAHLGRELQGSALHHCDNPKCWNVWHLYEGTQADNVGDMHTRGRAWRPERPGYCKRGHEFTPENTYSRSGGRRGCRECIRFHARYAARARRFLAR